MSSAPLRESAFFDMSKYPLTIFLPAAGLGERLRPVTNHLPKPLLPILGRPMIEGILERLTAVCSGRIGINLHWKPDLIRSWAAASPWAGRITFFPEDPVLGTGGALKNAESFLSSGPFIVHNADILLDIDFGRLIEAHLSSGSIATLVTHRHPKLSNVVVDGRGLVLDVENPGESRPDPSKVADKVAYTGIAVYSPEILRFFPPGISHATVAWIDAARAGHRVQTMDFTGSSWNDIGTPTSYAMGVLDVLRESGETVYLSANTVFEAFGMDGYVVVESGSTVEEDASLRNCIVMPGTRAAGSHENEIIGPDYTISLRETDFQPTFHAAEQKKVSLSDPLFANHFGMGLQGAAQDRNDADALLIGLGGSDRRYYRIRNDGKTVVLMECRPDDPDYERHIVYSRFFENHSVPVPWLIASDDDRKRAIFEDLGDMSLYSYLKLRCGNEHVEDIYRSVLDILVNLHSRVTQHIDECPPLGERVFDYDYFRWETGYFADRFLSGLKQLLLKDRGALDREFHRLAQKADGYPKGVIHRDFQCQNIMITQGGFPHLIDFQGARMAPPAYDVASILWDPYHRLDERVRSRLLEYYIDEMNHEASGFSEGLFRESLLPCRLQRHMQALGAYGFLSMVKGKKYFLKHVTEALRLLKEECALARDEYPELYRLVNNL